MNDAIELSIGERLFQSRAVSDIGFNKSVTRIAEVLADVGAFDIRFVEVVEIVDDRDLFDAGSQQSIDKMRADEARAASCENPFHQRLTL